MEHALDLDGDRTGLSPSEPVDVAVIARPGTPVEDLVEAVRELQESPLVRVASVEAAHGVDGA